MKSLKKDNFDYRPAPFWFLNHRLEKEELKRQILLMKEAGVSGFFMHPRAGLLTSYGSDKWYEMIRYIIDEAEKEGLKAWLYDEDPFPSGIAGGKVVFDNPEYAARKLVIKKLLPDGNGRVVQSLEQGRLLSAFAVKTDGTGAIIEQKEITGSIGIIRPLYLKSAWNSSYYAGMINEKPFPHFRAETFYPELQIDISLEEPGWALYIAMAQTVISDGKFGVIPDNLNKECVKSFIECTHEKYFKVTGEKFGNTIPGIFTDEPAAGGYLPWTGTFEAEFYKDNGYKIEENYCHLVDTFGEKSRKVRQDYWTVIHRMFKESYFEQISNWCREHGLKFTGHVICEEDPIYQVICGGNVYAYQKYFDIPGFDIIGENAGDRRYPGLLFGGKLISSAAHQQGKCQVSSECLACNAFNFYTDGMIKFANWLFALGITWLIPHGFFYSIDGDRKHDAGKSFFFQDDNFPDFKGFSEYTARVGKRLAESRHLCNVCLVYPVSVFWKLMPGETDKAEKLRQQLYNTLRTLFEEHIEFDIIDDETLFNTKVNSGIVECGQESYKVMIVPHMEWIGNDIQAAYEGFGNTGIELVFSEEDGKIDSKRLGETPAIYSEVTNSSPESDHKNLMTLRKSEGDDILLYAFNNAADPGCFAIQEKVYQYCYLYDAFSGDYYQMTIADGSVNFALQGYGAMIMLFTHNRLEHAPLYSIPDKCMSPVLLEYETNPQWDYFPPGGCISYVKEWDISLGSNNEDFTRKSFCLIRDIAGTQIAYIEKQRPIFDSAEIVKSIYPMQAKYKSGFFISQEDYDNKSQMFLLIENDTLQGECDIYINGNKLPLTDFKRRNIYDYFNMTAEIKHLIKQGENEIVIFWNAANEFDGIKSLIYII